jgi:hypothetical protein
MGTNDLDRGGKIPDCPQVEIDRRTRSGPRTPAEGRDAA